MVLPFFSIQKGNVCKMLYESLYYGVLSLETPLKHHGIKGMKWGVRNGPPYPLDSNSAKQAKKKAASAAKKKPNTDKVSLHKMKLVDNLSKELDTEWEYGVLHNGRHIRTEEEQFDWEKYRTIPVDVLKKEKIGTCWDFVNYQHSRLKEIGLADKSYMIMIDLRNKKDTDRIITHTFTVFTDKNKSYWLESAMYPKRGVHRINSVDDVIEQIGQVYKEAGGKNYSLFEYQPEGLDNGLSGDEFVDRVTENNWVKDGKMKKVNT